MVTLSFSLLLVLWWHGTSWPTDAEFKAACKTIPPIESDLPELYQLDKSGTGVLTVTIDNIYHIDGSELPAKEEFFSAWKERTPEHRWIGFRRYNIANWYFFPLGNITKQQYAKLLPGVQIKVKSLGTKAFVKSPNLEFIYYGFAATQSRDCFGLFGTQIILRQRK